MTRASPLAAVHEDAGARFTEFGGWEMPVQFDSIRAEHAAVREAVGRFDVSHMGEVAVRGPDARDLLDGLTTNDVAALAPGEAQYAMLTDEDGTIIDDTVVYRPPTDPPSGAPVADADYLFVPNAGPDEAAVARFREHREAWGLDAAVENATEEYALVAVPTDADIADTPRFGARYAAVGGHPTLVSRTGYTGEDGVEILCGWDAARDVWAAIDCPPCGLGARDTLRTEMGFLLSGQDFHPEENPRNPYEAGVGFAVDLDTDFVGRDALADIAEAGPAELFVGHRLEERGVPRHGYDIRVGGEAVGEVTSGTMSPTLEAPIGLGYLPVAHADPGTRVAVVVRGDPKEARVVDPPFLE
ncbi:MAG: glycine cleavage system aminomethyltransferase GcvT [Halobacteriaceae archaeon]